MSSPLCSSHARAIWPGVTPFAHASSRDVRRGSHVGVEVLALIARVVAAEVVVGILLGALDGAGQESAAQRRERHEADAEIAQQRE